MSRKSTILFIVVMSIYAALSVAIVVHSEMNPVPAHIEYEYQDDWLE